MINLTKENLIDEIDNGQGFKVFRLSDRDYKVILRLVSNQYRKNLLHYHPELAADIVDSSISEYHKFDISNHKEIWTKERRTLEEGCIKEFRNTELIESLKIIFGDIKITNEDNTRSEEIYWRLVRPNYQSDIGPLHADSWFWKLHNGPLDPSLRRIKIWISILNEKGKNGLRLIPSSQKMQFSCKGEIRDGKMKPVIDPSLEARKDIKSVNTEPGEGIIFHDDLIHGGFIGGNKTRVSIEFTTLIKK
jgi:hypothetical protein